MADVNKLTDAELEEAAQLLATRRAEAETARRTEELETFKPLTDAGIGTTKKTTVADLVAAIEGNRNLIPPEKYSHANAAVLGLRGLDEWLRGLQTAAEPVIVPTVAAP